MAPHCLDAKGNVCIQIYFQFLRAGDDVLTMHPAGESLIFQLLTDTWNVYIEDRSRGLDERDGGKKSGEFIAGKESLSEMRGSRYAGVLRMTHNRVANLLRPSLLGKNLVSHEGVLRGAGIFFVIKIVQQTSDAIGLAEGLGSVAAVPSDGCFLIPIRTRTSLHCKRMLEQTWRLGVGVQQGPGFGSCVSYCGHFVLFLHRLPWDSVFSRLSSEIRTAFSALTLLFNLTIRIPCITVIMNRVGSLR